MTADVATLEAGLREVATILGGFRAKLIEGELVDLQGIDGKVIGLCADIAELPPSQRSEFQGQLNLLLRDLKQISGYLVEQSAAVADAIEIQGRGTTAG
ncbi:MAG: hypothetical protein ACFCVH_12150 [Alphaproteobacteria bacterium]